MTRMLAQYKGFSFISIQAQEIEGDGEQPSLPPGAQIEDADLALLQEINFDDGAFS